MGRLEGKTAIVVGGGQTPGDTIGNGRATCLRFAQENAQVIVVDRSLKSAEETAGLIASEGGLAQAFQLDATDEGGFQGLVEGVLQDHGKIDILHNNVGIGLNDSSVLKVTEEAWDHIFSVNLKSALFSCKAIVPVMRKQGFGAIVNISSVAAIAGTGSITAYKASKAALNAFTQSLAASNAKYGVRANVIMPGLMNTPMAIEGYVAAGRDRNELVKKRDSSVPLGAKMGTAWDVANAALFLASDEAKFITGVNLPVDGGQAARIG